MNLGHNFCNSLLIFPKVFTPYYLNLVEVGELTGKLGEMLYRISVQLEKISDLKRKFIQAMTYPVLIITVAVLSVGFVLYYVIPTFSSIFLDFEAQLPWITQFVLSISTFFKRNALYLTLSVILGCSVIYKIRDFHLFREKSDRIIFQIPLVGNLVRKKYISYFCRTLGTLLSCRITMTTSLQTVSKSVTNLELRKDIQQMIYFIKKGDKLTRSLHHSRVFSYMVIQMITVGEETAELPEMLLKISEYYDKELDNTLDMLSSVVEPVIILFLGLIIGLILVSIYLPLFNMSGFIPGQ